MKDLVWFSQAVRKKLLKERQRLFDNETGGLLLGYIVEVEGERNWVVTDVSTAGPNAEHEHYHYTPDYKYDAEYATNHYSVTSGTEYYLGDWHTHPKGSTHASWSDRSTLFRNAKRATHTSHSSLMLIIGGAISSPEWATYKGVWACLPWRKKKARIDMQFTN
ncbi:MAG: Mov34/MPN/PAD-1 family protein [Neptuniibacter sp.]